MEVSGNEISVMDWKKDMIAVRTDANKIIAMGHLMRCLSIAVKLREQGEKVIFITSDDFGQEIINANGFQMICLYNSYDEKESEIPRLLQILKSYACDVLLLDSYEVSAGYMMAVKKVVKLVYIDDLIRYDYPVDMLVNYTLNVNMSQYLGKNNYCMEYLLGSNYIPLRKEFSQEPINIKETVTDIFITTGGSDPCDMIMELLGNLQDSKFVAIKKHIVVGMFYSKYEKLREIANPDTNINVYKNIPNIWDVMRKCDVAVSAGGTTLAELCACGIPTVCFSIADNQLEGTQAYAEAGIMRYAGDARNDRKQVLDDIIKYLIELDDYEIRANLASKAQRLIDGKGAERIAKQICRLL